LPPYADNTDKMIKNWKRLLNTDCKIFLPGHGNEIKRELLKKQYDRYA
jgi:glyoxylase-like metal-dependent hydrolase (beta-lactamase superfamily II)